MSGIYGTVKPAVIDIETDVDIFYSYRPNRGSDGASNITFTKVSDTKTWLSETYMNNNTTTIEGLYNLKLPLDIFGFKGIYTIYIKPKEYELEIKAIGTLQDFPDVRGVVFSSKQEDNFPTHLASTNSLNGYRIRYASGDNCIVTSSNPCKKVTGSNNNVFSFYASNSTLIFCTLTPSSANGFQPSNFPYIGEEGKMVIISNTKFNPIMFEIEMVDHDFETISYMLEGTQVRNLENGTFTTYNNENAIYNQFEAYTVKTRLGSPLYDIKRKKDVIDVSQSYDNVIGE